MEFKIMATSIMEVAFGKEGKPVLKGCAIDLDVSEGLDRNHYVDNDANFSEAGFKAIENCFVQGLVAVILAKVEAGHGDFNTNVNKVRSEILRALLAETKLVKTDAGYVRKGL